MTDKIFEIAKQVFNIDQVDIITSKENCVQWDSFNHLVLISELERVLQIEFTIEETEAMDSMIDIIHIVEGK
jgi:acyl carrier protein